MPVEKIKILLVEDNDADARLVSEYLRESQHVFFEIVRAKDLTAALKVIEDHKFEAVLSDLDLPDSRGLQTVENLISAGPELPLIVLTGFDDEKTGLEALNKNAQDYLVKGRMQSYVLIKSIRYAIERKRAEEALQTALNRFYLVLSNMPLAVLLVTEDGRIEFANQAFCEIFNLKESPADLKLLTSREMLEMIRPNYLHPEEAIAHIIDIVEQGQPVKDEDVLMRGARTFLRDFVPIRVGKNRYGRLWIHKDITERKRAEDILKRDKDTFERLVQERTSQLVEAQSELERAKRLSDIGVLASTVAHELRNPLAAIRMAASNIKRKANNPDLDKHLFNIEKKVAESDQIISNLLFYSRIRPPQYESVNIYEILDESIDNIAQGPKKGRSLIKNMDSVKDVVIRADPVQVKEVFNNILNNAYDAVAHENGEINIVAYSDGEFIKVTINDNGHGIAQENVAKVFDPFFTTKAKGTGLGLSVCRQIVTLHKGSIEIHSEPGKGTSVTVQIPKKE